MMDPLPLAADRLRDPKATHELEKRELIRMSFTVCEFEFVINLNTEGIRPELPAGAARHC